MLFKHQIWKPKISSLSVNTSIISQNITSHVDISDISQDVSLHEDIFTVPCDFFSNEDISQMDEYLISQDTISSHIPVRVTQRPYKVNDRSVCCSN